MLLLSVVLTMQHGNTFCWIYTETYRDTRYTLEKKPRYTKLMVNVYYVLIISGRFKWCVGYICTRLKTKICNIDGKYSQLQNIKIIQITPFYPKHIFLQLEGAQRGWFDSARESGFEAQIWLIYKIELCSHTAQMQQIFKSKDSKFIIIIIIYGVDRYYHIMDIGDNNNNKNSFVSRILIVVCFLQKK